ncbi:MAG: helix-turn-helix domain-containing protein, partial [Deltaproteobacteria bacterium]|nr:helix-turn-helix domain-containing protein [Deltaproteobacteria bacterium]
DLKEISDEILSKESISGNDLKKVREAMGIELEEIFEITRINISILKSIEDNQFGRLPPIIYLKNFLKSYTEILQIDSKKIIDGYMKNIDLIEQTI